MPLTKAMAQALAKRKDIVESIRINTDAPVGETYPLNAITGWTRDNYGPVWIPAKGKSINLTLKNLPVYERCIKVYEGNDLQVKGGPNIKSHLANAGCARTSDTLPSMGRFQAWIFTDMPSFFISSQANSIPR